MGSPGPDPEMRHGPDRGILTGRGYAQGPDTSLRFGADHNMRCGANPELRQGTMYGVGRTLLITDV